jgi:hypothetical protein
MSETRYAATIDGIGRLRFEQPELVAVEMSRLAGKRVSVIVKRDFDVRSLQQNKFMWAVYGDAVAEGTELVELASGLPVFKTREDVHGFAKVNLLRRPVLTNRGEINMLGTTTTLTTEEHARYMEMLFAKLAFYGVEIPER